MAFSSSVRLTLSALVLLLASGTSLVRAQDDGPTWKAGVAKVKITPETPMVMSGYAGRDKPFEGVLTDIWAKALVFEDPRGRRAAMVTLDLVGIDRGLSLKIRNELKSKYSLDNSQVALACSHTHTGPIVGNNLRSMWTLDEKQNKLIDDYSEVLAAKVVESVGTAIDGLKPAHLAWGNGHATFAVNRRNNKEAEVPTLRQQGLLKGPVDYDVPVLVARDAERKVFAVLFGYACHSTVLPFLEISGDYPGFAQIDLEAAYPGSVAMFFAGCGADQNPLPRRTVEFAKQYGSKLAGAVQQAIDGSLHPVAGTLETHYAEIPLPYAAVPTAEQIAADAQSKDQYVARRAALLTKQIEASGPLAPSYPYPIELWRIGDLQLFTLGGEVVVDYSRRIKHEFGVHNTWVAGYSNDVMAYIPSLRVLKEGGYEGASSMVYYGLPSIWGDAIEETIMNGVQQLANESE